MFRTLLKSLLIFWGPIEIPCSRASSPSCASSCTPGTPRSPPHHHLTGESKEALETLSRYGRSELSTETMGRRELRPLGRAFLTPRVHRVLWEVHQARHALLGAIRCRPTPAPALSAPLTHTPPLHCAAQGAGFLPGQLLRRHAHGAAAAAGVRGEPQHAVGGALPDDAGRLLPGGGVGVRLLRAVYRARSVSLGSSRTPVRPTPAICCDLDE